MTTLIGACGLDCAQCEAYLATQADDWTALAAVAVRWTQEYNAPGLTADNVQCDGCMTPGARSGIAASARSAYAPSSAGWRTALPAPITPAKSCRAFWRLYHKPK